MQHLSNEAWLQDKKERKSAKIVYKLGNQRNLERPIEVRLQEKYDNRLARKKQQKKDREEKEAAEKS